VAISERVFELASKVRQQKAGIETEEATKNAFVMPFISLVLGYDVFNPAEVIPEFTADVGVKRGEKIDYALVHGGQVQILIEAKKVNDRLVDDGVPPNMVQRVLGHEHSTTTLDLYTGRTDNSSRILDALNDADETPEDEDPDDGPEPV
jgi:hypothetical protein